MSYFLQEPPHTLQCFGMYLYNTLGIKIREHSIFRSLSKRKRPARTQHCISFFDEPAQKHVPLRDDDSYEKKSTWTRTMVRLPRLQLRQKSPASVWFLFFSRQGIRNTECRQTRLLHYNRQHSSKSLPLPLTYIIRFLWFFSCLSTASSIVQHSFAWHSCYIFILYRVHM